MQIRRDFLRALEAAIMGFFMVQAIRYVYAALYADVSSADLVRRLVDTTFARSQAGFVEPATVQTEIYAVLVVFLAPLVALFFVRTRWSIPLAVGLAMIARNLTLQLPDSSILAAALVIAAGLLYLTLIAVRRPRFLPILVAAGVAGDQIIRAWNATADPTFDPNFEVYVLGAVVNIGVVISAVGFGALLLTAITTLVEREEERLPGYKKVRPGVLTAWGALGLGGILYLEFTLLGLPNAVGRWTGVDYYLILPLMLMATMLPLVPEVRAQAGNFLSMFDGVYRGWLWALLLVLFVVVGKRFDGLAAGLMLALAQFLAILTLWWLVRQPESLPRLGFLRVNPTPIFVLLSMVVFVLLSVGDYFTYDYAFVRPFAAPFTAVSDLLSGMRGMGLPLVIVAVVLACMPMILERQVIPWREGRLIETLLTLGLVVAVTLSATRSAAPAPIQRPLIPDCLRVATYNIHGGYTPFFAPNLERVAQTILSSGADVVLLQEVESGLLRSGGVDQALWLADRLHMNATFYPLNEDLQGLAVLSRLDVGAASGAMLTSSGAQAGVQYVTYRLDESGDLHIYNVWLGFLIANRGGLPVPEQAQDQVQQVDEVARLIAANHFGAANSAPDRVILGGTFNHAEDSPLYEVWNQTIFLDPFTGLFAERRDTLFLVDGTTARFDYLWLLNLVPSGIVIDQVSAASDHRLSLVAVGREAGKSCP